MAADTKIAAKIVRDHYSFAGVGIPRGTVVEVTASQFEAMTADTPATAEKATSEDGDATLSLVPRKAPVAEETPADRTPPAAVMEVTEESAGDGKKGKR